MTLPKQQQQQIIGRSTVLVQYTLHMVFRGKTVKDGEQALVSELSGKTKLIVGPARVSTWRKKFQILDSYFAAEGQFLEVNYKSKPRENIPGPVQIFFNPIEHDSIRLKDAVLVTANEVLIVYGRDPSDPKGQSFSRSILRGPIQYVPKANEWIHEFSWHGEDPTNKTRKLRNALKFTKLRTIADQTYYDVPEVRTADDTQITVKLMIFFELVDLEKMLDKTHDPIADFINAASSDVIQYCSGVTYEEFVENTSVMNNLSTFSQLASRAQLIGYQVTKVVFRGFHSSNALQSMHDKAIYERTRLRLEAETEDHRQKTLDLQLLKEEERSKQQRELEREKDEHKRSLAREAHAEKLGLRSEELTHEQNKLDLKAVKEKDRMAHVLAAKQEEDEHKRKHERQLHEDQMLRNKEKTEAAVAEKKLLLELDQMRLQIEKERIKALKDHNVDITQVLVAEARGEPHKTIRIENDTQQPHLHIHEPIQDEP